MLGKFFNKLRNSQPSPAANLQNKGEYKRFNDAILVISQDNLYNKLPIKGCNERAIKLLGMTENEINNKDLRDIVPPNTKEIIDDYIEFIDEGRGVDEVLQKISNFRVINSSNKEVPVKLRVIRGLCTFETNSFQLVMSDESLNELLESGRKQFANENHEVFDIRTGLFSKESILHDIELISDYSKRMGIETSYAIFTFEKDSAIIKRLGKMIEAGKRDTDIVGLISENAIILIMPDTPIENTKIPVQRFMNSLPEDTRNGIKTHTAKLEDLARDV